MENPSQTRIEMDNATPGPFGTMHAYTTKNRIVKLSARGKALVASAATWGDWLRPMNRKEKPEIDGRPPIVPPNLVPRKLAVAVAKLTHAPPMSAASPIRRKLSRRGSVINRADAAYESGAAPSA